DRGNRNLRPVRRRLACEDRSNSFLAVGKQVTPCAFVPGGQRPHQWQRLQRPLRVPELVEQMPIDPAIENVGFNRNNTRPDRWSGVDDGKRCKRRTTRQGDVTDIAALEILLPEVPCERASRDSHFRLRQFEVPVEYFLLKLARR